MARLVPATHVSIPCRFEGLDGRDRPRVSGTVCAYHAAISSSHVAHVTRRRRAARVACGLKSRESCMRPEVKCGLLRFGRWRGLEQFYDWPPMHQGGSDEPRKGGRACKGPI